MKAKLIIDWEEFWAAGPGAIRYRVSEVKNEEGRILVFKCPNCGLICQCPLYPPHWTMTGSDELPTLNPSILHKFPETCGWHGYLRNGIFEPC